LHSLEEDGDRLFITMELIDGVTLANAMPPRGLALQRWMPLAAQLADARQAAHAHGHRPIAI
jgi:hypothetical protein